MTDLTAWLDERDRIRSAGSALHLSQNRWGVGVDNDDGETYGMTHAARPEDAEAIVDAHNHLPALTAALRAVLNLHKPESVECLTGDCATELCEHDEVGDCETAPFTYCAACHDLADRIDTYYAERGMAPAAYPCPTVTAITNAIEGAS